MTTADAIMALFEERFVIPEPMRDIVRAIAEATVEFGDEQRIEEREACAKIADQFGRNAEYRAAGHNNGDARNSALDKFEAAINIAALIRERT